MLTTAEFRNHFNLQSGEKCFITEDKLIVTSEYKINPDSFTAKRGKSRDLKKIRLAINVVLTVVVFTLAFYFSIYPLILLMFLILWDVKQLKHYTLPISTSNCIQIDWIEKVQIRKGNLGFSYIDLFFKSDKGVNVMRPLKVYDSDEELEVAIRSFEKLGLLEKDSFKIAKGDTIEGDSYKLNNRTEIVFNNKGIYFTKDGVYETSNPDAFGLKLTLFSVLCAIGLTLISVQTYKVLNGAADAPAVTMIFILIAITLIPLKQIRKSNTNFIAKEDILGYEKLDSYTGRIKFKKGKLKLFRKFPVLNFSDFEKIEESFQKTIA